MERNNRKWLTGFALAAGVMGVAAGALANETLDRASKDPGSWLMYGRTYDHARYSPLKQVTAANVKNLKVAWSLQMGVAVSNESTPLVVGDTLYVTSPSGPKYVFAVDAATGLTRWRYQPELPADFAQYACCDVPNRGAAYADGKLFVGLIHGFLVALDAKTGKELWKTQVVDYKQGAVITSPPLVVKNLVVTGFGGGEYGARGNITAYNQADGKQVWRTWTVPGPGETGSDSWKGDSFQHGGGTAWLTGSYDPATNTIFYGTSNPGPWNAAVRGSGTSDYGKFTNLYTASTVAFDADSGKIKWHLQTTPHDAWDYDGVNEAVLADLTIGGQKVPTMMKADRNGFFYVANRTTGKLISAQTFVPTNWAKSIDLATAKPVEDPAKRPRLDHKAVDICPNLVGGKNWAPMSFSPDTGLVYISSNNMCMDMVDLPAPEYKRGVMYLGKEFPTKPGPGGYLGEMIAWNPVTQKKAWGIQEKLPLNTGGTLSTGGGLVFYGNQEGWFKAHDAKTGKELWRFNVGSGMGGGPISYSVGGKQYIAVSVGRSTIIPIFMGGAGVDLNLPGAVRVLKGPIGAHVLEATPEGSALFVFKL